MKRSCRFILTLVLFLLCLTITSSVIAAEPEIGKRRAGLMTVSTKVAPGKSGIYIVRLADPPLALYRGGIRNFAPTAAAGVRKLDIESSSALAYRQYLGGKQNVLEQGMAKVLTRPVPSRFRYEVVFNGMAVELTRAEAEVVGQSFTSGYGQADLVYVGDPPYNDALALGPFAPGTFDGEIVVCDRGEIGRVEKGENLLAGGAGGMVLLNSVAEGDSLSADMHVLPAIHLTYSDGIVLKDWLAASTDPRAAICGTTLEVGVGDVMASFSSRGPNLSVADSFAEFKFKP